MAARNKAYVFFFARGGQWAGVANGVTSSCRAFGRRDESRAGRRQLAFTSTSQRGPMQHEPYTEGIKAEREAKMWCLLGTRRYRHCARDGKAKKVDVCKRQLRVDSSLWVVRACAWLIVSPRTGLAGEPWGSLRCPAGLPRPAPEDHCLTTVHGSASG